MMSTLTTSIQLTVLAKPIWQENETNWKELKLAHAHARTHTQLELIKMSSKVAGYKINLKINCIAKH